MGIPLMFHRKVPLAMQTEYRQVGWIELDIEDRKRQNLGYPQKNGSSR